MRAPIGYGQELIEWVYTDPRPADMPQTTGGCVLRALTNAEARRTGEKPQAAYRRMRRNIEREIAAWKPEALFRAQIWKHNPGRTFTTAQIERAYRSWDLDHPDEGVSYIIFEAILERAGYQKHEAPKRKWTAAEAVRKFGRQTMIVDFYEHLTTIDDGFLLDLYDSQLTHTQRNYRRIKTVWTLPEEDPKEAAEAIKLAAEIQSARYSQQKLI